MRHLLIAAILICTLFLIGCKIPQNTLDSFDTINKKIAVVEEICMPLVEQGIEEGEKALEETTDPKMAEKLTKLLEKLKDVKEWLPKIVRNLKQIKKNLDIFNGMIEQISEDLSPENG